MRGEVQVDRLIGGRAGDRHAGGRDYARQLKPAGRRHLTRQTLATRLRDDLTLLAGVWIWPAVQRSD